jgi:nucleotide-binding universal stress UspA family protein|tara:strand:- start:104539 stop:105390 length:852 start_codon:yes stop_codon:yes gene_type:complete
MEHVLACVDASSYANSVCDLAAWAASQLQLPVELLHVVQRKDPVAARHDLSGAIGLGVKSDLMEELVRLEESDARLQVERGRVLLKSCEDRLRGAGVEKVTTLHRHGGIVETIVEREEDARIVVIGKRGASHEFAADHIGSKIERVVRTSNKPILIASKEAHVPERIVLAYDGSAGAKRALERLANSPLFTGLPVHIVMAESEDDRHRKELAAAAETLQGGRTVETTLRRGKAEEVISAVVADRPGTMLMMGAYGHSPLRALIIGSTTTSLIRSVHVPVLLVR